MDYHLIETPEVSYTVEYFAKRMAYWLEIDVVSGDFYAVVIVDENSLVLYCPGL